MHSRWLPVGVIMLVFALSADAHPVPFSYVDVQLHGALIDLTITIHIFDLAHDLQVTPMERLLDPAFLKEREEAIRQLLSPRFTLEEDGRSPAPEWQQVEPIEDRQSVRLHLHYPGGSVPGRVSFSSAMFPYDETHQSFVNIYENDSLTSQVILDRNHIRMEYYAGTRQGVLAVLRKFIPAGIHHILIGPDHLLFLVGLLLMGGSIRR